MVEIRWLVYLQAGMRQRKLQWRLRDPVCDASGALCGFGDWGDWQDAPIVDETGLPANRNF